MKMKKDTNLYHYRLGEQVGALDNEEILEEMEKGDAMGSLCP